MKEVEISPINLSNRYYLVHFHLSMYHRVIMYSVKDFKKILLHTPLFSSFFFLKKCYIVQETTILLIIREKIEVLFKSTRFTNLGQEFIRCRLFRILESLDFAAFFDTKVIKRLVFWSFSMTLPNPHSAETYQCDK